MTDKTFTLPQPQASLRCRYCNMPIYKVIVGWMHTMATPGFHIARPRKAGHRVERGT